MADYQNAAHWSDPKKKLFQFQVGFTCPPHDFDAAPSGLLCMSPASIGGGTGACSFSGQVDKNMGAKQVA